MNNEKDKWMENVFQSMKDSQRAKPSPELFTKIKNQISTAGVDPLLQWRYVVAAAVLMLLINSMALIYYIEYKQVNDEHVAVGRAYKQSLINSYQIY